MDGPEAIAFANRISPVVLVEDFTGAFETTQGALRPWTIGRDSTAIVTQLQLRIHVPANLEIVSIIDKVVFAGRGAITTIATGSYPAVPAVALATVLAAQFQNRRGVVVTSTGIEPSTVVSITDAAAGGVNPVYSFAMRTGSQTGASREFAVGTVLGPGDALQFDFTALEDITWTVYGRERPADRK